MRINVYAEELPDEREVEGIEVVVNLGRKKSFYGARIFLKSPKELHDVLGDDDRSAVTFFGPPTKVARILRAAADAIEDKAARG